LARLKNHARTESMRRWYKVACADMARPIDPKVLEEFEEEYKQELCQSYDYDPGSIPIERQIKVMLALERCMPCFARVAKGRLVVHDQQSLLDAVTKELEITGSLDSTEEAAILALLTLLELRMLPTGKMRGCSMQAFEVAAELFNAQLERDKALKRRLDEDPISDRGIYAALDREGQIFCYT